MATSDIANDTKDVPFSRSAAASAAGGAMDSPSTGGDTATTAPVDVMSQVVQMAHDTIDKLAEKAAPKVQRLQEGVAHTNQLLHDGADKLRTSGDEWTDSLRTTVRENPLAALAAAAAAGVLLAWLMRSSD